MADNPPLIITPEMRHNLERGAMPRLKWTHPSWAKFLIVDPGFTLDDLKRNDFLGEEDDPALATVETVHMTDQEVEDLGEWDG